VYIVWNQPRGSQKVVCWILKRCSIFLARDCFLGGLDGLSCSCLVCRTEARPRRGKCATVFHARVKKSIRIVMETFADLVFVLLCKIP
jgi:hypothetical protein